MSDNVNHPSHYAEGRKYEPKDVIRDWRLNFNLGNAVKYLSRAGRKNDKVEDLKKAQTYIQFELDAIAEENGVKPAPQFISKRLTESELDNLIPNVADLLEMTATGFVARYCTKGLHSGMMQKFKAGSKVYFVTSIRAEDEGVVKKVTIRLAEREKRLLLSVTDKPRYLTNTIEIKLEG